MDIVQATENFEQWLSHFMDLRQPALDKKHTDMASDVFLFLRATYYRWAQQYPVFCGETASAPKLLSVGDLHVDNFGTWRDIEGRLVWGVNDFDEAAKLPYTNDLVRLALSAKMSLEAAKGEASDWRGACDAIAEGYRDALSDAAENLSHVKPIVLAESHGWLARIAAEQAVDPERFWNKLDRQVHDTTPSDSKIACAILRGSLPDGCSNVRWTERVAGEGSLGHPRIVALVEWHGAKLAREAKAMAPSAAHWARVASSRRIKYGKIVKKARRSPDPYLNLVVASDGNWIVRRLAPDCSRVEIDALTDNLDERLLHAMGHETANIHLGQPERCKEALDHLNSLGPQSEWLHSAVAAMEESVKQDFEDWRTHWTSLGEKSEPAAAGHIEGR